MTWISSRGACASRSRASVSEVDAVELDAAGGGFDEAQNHATRRRLAAARFTDEAECFAGHHVERDVVHGAHGAGRLAEHAFLDREMLGEAADGQQRRTLDGSTGGRRGEAVTT